VSDRTLEWLETLATALFWAAATVLGLAVIGALIVATSESTIPGIDVLQRENRGLIAIAALGAGFTAAGVLAALGGILRLLLAEHRRTRA
jgi:hypothetical protein